jgi:SnoaL-like domain
MAQLDDDLIKRLRRQLEQADAKETLYRYCSTIDRKDMAGLRDTLADDVHARYGNGDWIVGADDLVKWIDSATADALWQHHLINVYHVDIDGDQATALSYHTSHQAFASDPEVTQVIIARYHDKLGRTDTGWKITEKVMEVLWAGERTDPNGRLEAIGGRGPVIDT